MVPVVESQWQASFKDSEEIYQEWPLHASEAPKEKGLSFTSGQQDRKEPR